MRAGCLVLSLLLCGSVSAQEPLLPSQQWAALRAEVSGSAPYENLRYLTGLHRVPGTPAFEQAAQFIVAQAREYGLDDAHSEEFPIDGQRTYGIMRSYLAWKVESGRLWEVRPQHLLIGDVATDPIRLADYSHSASLETSLIDVGNGTSESDYAGKDVRGKIVLADGQLIRVQHLAVSQHAAAGILSDMPNQTTAWSGLDPTLVRWGHLDARQPAGFAFMISRQSAALLRARLAAREEIVLNAQVKATVGPGHWTVDSATIAGTDAAAGQVVLTCHLDHERPGANDDGSGCVTILEVARTLNRLIHAGALPRPKRTIRFIWGPEHEGTMAYLAMHPEIRKELRADLHMDMVGGDPFKDKAVLHVTETPWSLPSFVTDVGALFMETIRTSASEYAEGEGSPAEALVETRTSEGGTRNEFIADVTPFDIGSDHDDYDSSTIAIPSLYLRDWPDTYIHTDHDSLDQMDSTKLRRVAALGAAAAYVYANIDTRQLAILVPFFTARSEERLAKSFAKAQRWVGNGMDANTAWYEARNLLTQELQREQGDLRSLIAFSGSRNDAASDGVSALNPQAAVFNAWLDRQAQARGAKAPVAPWATDANGVRVPVRTAPFGPVENQNDDALSARLSPERYREVKLINGAGGPQAALYTYEILNFVNGLKTVGEIRDAVSAEFGPIDVSLVADYLGALADAKIIRWKSPGE